MGILQPVGQVSIALNQDFFFFLTIKIRKLNAWEVVLLESSKMNMPLKGKHECQNKSE